MFTLDCTEGNRFVKVAIFSALSSVRKDEVPQEIRTFAFRNLLRVMIHKIKGTVVRGNGLGHRLGYPTANIPIDPDMPVRDGVYAAQVNVKGTLYDAMVNIGMRPTVAANGSRVAEACLFGFSEELYGLPVTIFLLGYIRPERKFENIEELKSQLAKDKEEVFIYFNNISGY